MKNEYTPVDCGITDSDIVFDVAVDSFPEESNDIINALHPDGTYDEYAAKVFINAVYGGKWRKHMNDAQKVAANWKPE